MAKMIRVKKRQLPRWDDKVSAAHRFIKRYDSMAIDADFSYRIIRWHCLVNMFGGLVDKVYVSIEAVPRSPKYRAPKTLVISAIGEPFCPHCLTNEYLASMNDFMPISQRSNEAGKYCLVCKRQSK